MPGAFVGGPYGISRVDSARRLFDLSDVPNSARLDPGFHEFQTDLEIEHRHEIANRSGRALLTVFQSVDEWDCSMRP